jgi:LuxR family transcriptional regulator, maltose regulon positive regulatory protein
MHRYRLFNLLDNSRVSVIYIKSPPGSGKTSLIASYLNNRNLPYAWYKFDEGDADIGTFCHYMGIVTKKIAPKYKRHLPLLTREFMSSIPLFSKRYFENIFNRITTPYTFVFENHHVVPPDSQLHEMMGHGLSDIPDGIQIIISSRTGPPSQFFHMQFSSKIQLYGWEDIRFTRDEVRELARMKKMGSLPEETIRYLHEKTDGWVAGIILMLEGMKRLDIECRVSEKFTMENLFEYFASEIFQKVDSDTQKFLLKTAFLPIMTIPFAEQLTGINRSGEILNSLSNTHYFTEKYPHDTSVYYYHSLFREFLLAKAKELFTAHELCQTKKYAAMLLEGDGNIEDAILLLLDCGDFEELTRIIVQHAPVLIAQGRYLTLLAWMEYFPKEVYSGQPWLLYYMGVCKLQCNPAESLFHFEIAFDQFQMRKDARGIFQTWSGIVEAIMYGHEGLELLDRWFSVLDEIMQEFKTFPSEDIEANVTCSMVRALSLRRPPKFNMNKWIDRIQEIAQTTKEIPIKIRSNIIFAGYLYSEGNFQKLGIILESNKEIVQREDIPPLTRLTFDWLSAAYCNVMSLYDECQRIVSEGLELAHSLKISVLEYMLLGHGMLSSLKKGDFETAQQLLEKMAHALSLIKPWEAGFYHYCAAWEALYKNNIALARTHSEYCLRLCEKMGHPWILSTCHILIANIFFAFGEFRKSVEHINQARSIGIQSTNEFTPFICLLTEAYFLLQQGKEAVALAAIRKGMQVGKEKGFVNIFMCQKGVMEAILTKSLECGIEETYVKELIKKNAIVPDTSHIVVDQWPWPLKIFTLGRFNIIKDGKPLQYSKKVQQKPLLMLKAIIAFGGREVPKDRIADILWPEAEGDAAHSAFTTTLFRLRQLLGIEQAIQFHESKIYLDPRYCWVDVWAFERILGNVDAAWVTITERSSAAERYKSREREQAVKLTEKAIKMYTGPFLSGDHEQWMVSIRERLRNKFLRTVRRLGFYMEQGGKYDKAVDFYQKGLEVDDLTEEFYQRLMKCYQKMGKRAEALAAYKRCYQILSSVLGIEPSPETEAIRKMLKS